MSTLASGGFLAQAPGQRAKYLSSAHKRQRTCTRAPAIHQRAYDRDAASQQQQHHQQQRQQQQAALQPALARSAMLRHALVSAAAAAALPAFSTAAAGAAAADVAALSPLQPVAASLGEGRPRSSLVLADPQLLPLQPGPVSFPRRQLELNFAVLLLRSGYQACDDLDFIPMDEFQKRFWKLRQAEWQPYTLLYSPLRITQGKLEDPLYLDFISFSQAAAAGVAMAQGTQVFKEYDEESEGMVVVTRDPLLADNALLPARFFERQGELIYRGLVEGFRGQQFGGPPPCRTGASHEELLAGVEALLSIMAANGYALKTTLTPGGSSSGGGPLTFTVRLEGPANLWSLQALAARRSSLYGQHDAAAVAAFLRASGRSSTCRLSWNDTAVTQQWTLAA